MSKRKKTTPELHVIFDTSVLYTQVAYDLMRSDVRQIIKANSKHPDLGIHWHLPSIVVDERRYQMKNKALDFLPTIEKLEKLLGYQLDITDDILTRRVNEAIERQLKELGISILDIDTTIVNWKDLIKRAVYRHPPFKSGEQEKGFRDALIAETFLQLVEKLPTTPTVCRLAVITNDGLLRTHITQSTQNANNVRILSDVNELESLINTLVSEVTEEFVKDLKEKAAILFFENENLGSLIYKEKLGIKIRDLYGKEMQEIPKEGLLRENGAWWIGEPVFIKKERQRIYWMTLISIDAKLFKYEWIDPQTPLSSFSPGFSPAFPSARQTSEIAWSTSSQFVHTSSPIVISSIPGAIPSMGLLGMQRKVIDVAKGQSKFEILWSTNITMARKLTSPRIDKIQFVETKWEE